MASAATKDNPNITQWGQSYAYDGFGNLTTVATIKGSTTPLSVTYDASTNRRTSECADANGNLNASGLASPCQNGLYTYDIANRIAKANISGGEVRYSYGPGNRRVWRGTWSSSTQTVDEITFYSAGGAQADLL